MSTPNLKSVVEQLQHEPEWTIEKRGEIFVLTVGNQILMTPLMGPSPLKDAMTTILTYCRERRAALALVKFLHDPQINAHAAKVVRREIKQLECA